MSRIAVVLLAFLAAATVFATARQEASSAPYSEVVDNSDGDRFAASRSWQTSETGAGVNGEDYRVVRPSKKGGHALFEVPVPSDGKYAVYARWPKVRGLNDKVGVGVETAYGTKWTRVNQRKDGGKWVRIGEFEMRKDEKFPVRISHNTEGKGIVAADAVKVEKISSYEKRPPAADAPSAGGGPAVVEEARKYLGTRYVLGGPEACDPYDEMDCTCLTTTVFEKFGARLPDGPADQLEYGTPVAREDLRPGDVVFHKEDGRTITHVSIYAGDGKVVHASSYFGEVVESEMEYIRGFYAARRLV